MVCDRIARTSVLPNVLSYNGKVLVIGIHLWLHFWTQNIQSFIRYDCGPQSSRMASARWPHKFFLSFRADPSIDWKSAGLILVCGMRPEFVLVFASIDKATFLILATIHASSASNSVEQGCAKCYGAENFRNRCKGGWHKRNTRWLDPWVSRHNIAYIITMNNSSSI